MIPPTPPPLVIFAIPLKRNEHHGEGWSKIEKGLESEKKERIRLERERGEERQEMERIESIKEIERKVVVDDSINQSINPKRSSRETVT